MPAPKKQKVSPDGGIAKFFTPRSAAVLIAPIAPVPQLLNANLPQGSISAPLSSNALPFLSNAIQASVPTGQPTPGIANAALSGGLIGLAAPSFSAALPMPAVQNAAAGPSFPIANLNLPEAAAPIETLPSLPVDIGLYVGKHVTDAEKFELLRRDWEPPQHYAWPFSERVSKNKLEKRFLRPDHLAANKFLAYSPSYRGLFCRYCVLFHGQEGGRGGQKLGFLVTEPLTKFSAMFGKRGYVTCHANYEYHLKCKSAARSFQECYQKPEKKIINKVSSGRLLQVKRNRQMLKPIIKSVIFLGRQGLAFRGHRDDGAIRCSDAESTTSLRREGNFRALLKFRVESGDNFLKGCLQDSAGNARYTSKTVQNDLIKCCGDVISDSIISDLRATHFFAVLADDTTDCSRSEQMSLCVRFVHDNVVREEFLKFVSPSDLTGAGLAQTISTNLQNLGLDLTYLVGQGYDGASSMSGQFSGVQAEIRKLCPKALYVHCASHSLNLVLTKSSELQAVRNCYGTISEVASFINWSAKRTAALSSAIKAIESEAGEGSSRFQKRKLQQLCETRWVERHDSVITFKRLFTATLAALSEMEGWRDSNASAKARMLGKAMADSNFIVTLCVLDRVLGITISLSRALQATDNDLLSCMVSVADTTKLLQSLRDTSESEFKAVFADATALAESAEVELSMPRVAKRQTHRANVSSDGPEDYYRKTIFIPFLDNVLMQLQERFMNHQQSASSISAVIPRFLEKYSKADFNAAVAFYQDFLDCDSIVSGEYDLWKSKWSGTPTAQLPSTAIETLPRCNDVHYPNIYKLVQILATLPVTTTTAERSFSSLRLLKNYLRSTTGEERLSGLAIMYIHKQKPINVDMVISKFAQLKSRRKDFLA